MVEVKYLYVRGMAGSRYQPIYLGVRDDVPVADRTVRRLKADILFHFGGLGLNPLPAQ
jgi:hypothetical protein